MNAFFCAKSGHKNSIELFICVWSVARYWIAICPKATNAMLG